MKTKIKQIALPLVVVIAVLLAFTSPAVADYSGDHPLTTYEHGFLVNGGLIYETVTDGTAYTTLPSDGSVTQTQPITITIPKGTKVKTAKLYNYYSWSKSDYGNKYVPGDPAEATLTFNGATVTCQNPSPITNPIDYGTGVIQYWDTKGPNYACGVKYDYPSGTFAWDVTDLVTGSGTYTATITNADSSPTPNEYFVTWGFGLLVVYEKPGKKAKIMEYWIDEGCDILLNTSKYGVYEPLATTNAPFDAKELKGKEATLTTVVMAPDKGYAEDWSNSMNMVYFNGLKPKNQIGPCTIDPTLVYPYTTRAIGVNDFDVTLKRHNIAYFQDRDLGTGRGDNIAVSNAFLVAKK